MSLVSLVKFNEQSMSLQQAIEKSLDLIHFSLNRKFQKIALKPNLCYYWDYSTGQTTDPRFVSALIDVVRYLTLPDVEISIVESDASAMKCMYAFPILGYEKMAKEKGVRLMNLTNDQTEKINTRIGNRTYHFHIPKTIAEADILINVPKIKYMEQVRISCALKNIYGCNPYPKKFKYHKHLNDVIVALNKVMRPHLTVLDGITVVGTHTRRLGLIMASTDPVAIDSAAARIAGINPHSLKYLQLASREKVGNLDFVVSGETLDYFKHLFPRKTKIHKAREILSKLYFRFASNH